MTEARSKFIHHDPKIQREALEKLWDAWERLKSIESADKKTSIRILLDSAATDPMVRSVIEDDARALTDAGNNFMIRHTEVGKISISNDAVADYLFTRAYNLIHFVLQRTGRLQ